MPVAFNNAGTPTRTGASSTSSAFSVTAAGSNRCAFALIGFNNVTGLSVTSVTYGGIAMTAAGTPAHNVTSHAYTAIYYLVNPPTGSNTLAVTCSGSTVEIYVNLVSFTGVDQTTPVRAASYTTATGSSAAPAVTVPSNASDKTISCCLPGGVNVTATNQTSDGLNVTGTMSFGSDHETGTAASVTHTWTTDASGQWAVSGLSIQADAGAATFVPYQPQYVRAPVMAQ